MSYTWSFKESAAANTKTTSKVSYMRDWLRAYKIQIEHEIKPEWLK